MRNSCERLAKKRLLTASSSAIVCEDRPDDTYGDAAVCRSEMGECAERGIKAIKPFIRADPEPSVAILVERRDVI